jgi:hypothetical protein
MKLLIILFFQPPVTSSLFGSNILHSTLFPNTLSLYFFLNVRDQVSHPYRITGKNIVSYILLYVFYSRRENKNFWTERQEALPEFKLLFNFLLNQIFIFIVIPGYLNATFQRICGHLRVIILHCILVTRQ